MVVWTTSYFESRSTADSVQKGGGATSVASYPPVALSLMEQALDVRPFQWCIFLPIQLHHSHLRMCLKL